MDYNQELQDGIVYFATVITNVFYILIVGMLYLFADLPIEGICGIAFGIGILFSTVSMTFIALRALKLEADRAKTIIRLAIFHIPALVGLTILFVSGFVVI